MKALVVAISVDGLEVLLWRFSTSLVIYSVFSNMFCVFNIFVGFHAKSLIC